MDMHQQLTSGYILPMRAVDAAALGQRLRSRREAIGLSQGQLAAIIGMSQQGINHIESGKVQRPRGLRELAGCLATTEEWLLWGEGPEQVGDPIEMSAQELVENYRQMPAETRRICTRIIKWLLTTHS